MIHKILNLIITKYQVGEVQRLVKGAHIGKGSEIEFPITIDNPDCLFIGDDSNILSNARVQTYPDLTGVDSKIRIGNHTYICYRVSLLAGADITIGDNVVIASDVSIVSYHHGMNPCVDIPYMDQALEIAPIIIENNCWIGDKVIILPGVTVGHDSIIGGGSVVTKDVPPYSIIGGNPARLIKKFDIEKKRWIRMKE